MLISERKGKVNLWKPNKEIKTVAGYHKVLQNSGGDKYKSFFIFPGNINSHGKGKTLFSKILGKGLAKIAGLLSDQGFPNLSWITVITKKENTKERKKQEEATQQAIIKAFWAQGLGYEPTLPVKTYEEKKKFYDVPIKFSKPQIQHDQLLF